MDNELSIVEKLGFATIRIECDTASGRSTGTGFFCRFADEGLKFVPGIVTNKHVVAGGTTGRLHFTLSTPDNKPDVGNAFQWNIAGNFADAWIQHPDPDIDLYVLPIASLIEGTSQNSPYFLAAVRKDVRMIVPSESKKRCYERAEPTESLSEVKQMMERKPGPEAKPKKAVSKAAGKAKPETHPESPSVSSKKKTKS